MVFHLELNILLQLKNSIRQLYLFLLFYDKERTCIALIVQEQILALIPWPQVFYMLTPLNFILTHENLGPGVIWPLKKKSYWFILNCSNFEPFRPIQLNFISSSRLYNNILLTFPNSVGQKKTHTNDLIFWINMCQTCAKLGITSGSSLSLILTCLATDSRQIAIYTLFGQACVIAGACTRSIHQL